MSTHFRGRAGCAKVRDLACTRLSCPMKDKINPFALLIATVASIVVVVTLAAAHYAAATATHMACLALNTVRSFGWPEL